MPAGPVGGIDSGVRFHHVRQPRIDSNQFRKDFIQQIQFGFAPVSDSSQCPQFAFDNRRIDGSVYPFVKPVRVSKKDAGVVHALSLHNVPFSTAAKLTQAR